MVKKTMIIILSCMALLVLTLLARTMLYESKQIHVQAIAKEGQGNTALAGHLSGALKLQTISYGEKERFDGAAFIAFRDYLADTYPNAHKALVREVVNNYSALYRWEGTNKGLEPVLFIAHSDVVPAEEKTQWTEDPFGGIQKDGYIWGRGALDDKTGVISLFEAIEDLSKSGYQPERTLYIALGHDEELVGPEGAGKMAEILRSRGVRFDCIYDEGGIISKNMLPGVNAPVALIGIAEKGYLSLELSVEGEPGHSSIPPVHTSIGILSKAITRIEDQPFGADIDGAAAQMFAYMGPEMPFLQKAVFANLGIFKPIVVKQLVKSPTTNALIRNTTAITMIQGGTKENILPPQARAVVNIRVLPGQNTPDVIKEIERIIDDKRIKVKAIGHTSEPSAVARVDTIGFKAMEKSVRQVFPDAIVAPYLLTGGTDSAHYADLAKNIYRFRPVVVDEKALKTIHGNNEKISGENLQQSFVFCRQLIMNSCGSSK